MWITDFRERFGISLEQLGAQIRKLGAKQDPPLRVSDVLLERLETEPNFRTVPALADLIAEACGATAKQRDALVLEKYRGTWKPPRRRKAVEPKPTPCPPGAVDPPPARPAPTPAQRPVVFSRGSGGGARQVVKLNRQGVELARYRSCGYASAICGCSEKLVQARCHRRYRFDEFTTYGYTFRFAEEWDAMSPADQAEDLSRHAGVKAPRFGGHGAQMVTVISRHGQVRDYDSIKQAAAACGIGYALLQKQLYTAWQSPVPGTEIDGVRFIFTSEWDELDDGMRGRFLVPNQR